MRTIPASGYTAYVIDLTSQQWRTPAEVNRTIWKHWLTIIRPDEVRSTNALLSIGGGSVTATSPERADAALADIAVTTHTVVAALSGIPNEPLTFAGETASRNEDGIINYTWVKFMQTGDETWPLRLPMTKASVRALDTITAFLASPDHGGLPIDHFYIAGASKRGWTTWTTAAVDKRVIGISPLVIDTLNITKALDHHYQAYGEYAEALKDYTDSRIVEAADLPQFTALMKIVEPYSYLARYTMPKYIVNSAGDQYFLPDSSQFYFGDLPGEKYLRYVPNTDHSLRGSDALQTVAAFYDAVNQGRPRPRFTWSFEKDNSIKVVSQDKPTEVRLWSATNPDKRDFRLATLGPKYTSTVLTPETGNTWVARIPKPAQGWTAFFVELTFPSGIRYPFKFTTGVRVTPDTLPFPLPRRNVTLKDLR
ncbi:MAG: PhoPQ-activated pathogenicity-related protein [Bryobacterales bacterium]|nr:PhoPQ-activated pathogenicity-related protein [Bryobacterales bacterium]